METESTSELLRRYAAGGSDDAFVELMRRYVDLVYGAALRRLNGDEGLAQDAAQRVFMELAQHARKLRAESTLGGWLYTRATRIAADMHKSECRRRVREQTAAGMAASDPAPEAAAAWAEASPHLEDAIGRLSPADRDAVVLRFIENRPLRSVGAALGVSEDAVQKRISRALEKLRRQLVRRGVACTAGGLALTLSKNSASAAQGWHPLILIGRITAAAGLKKNPAALLLQAIAMKPPAIAAVAVVIAGVAIPLLVPEAPDRPMHSKADARNELLPPQRPVPTAPEHGNPVIIPGRQNPVVALLPGITAEERAAALKSARTRAEKATLERYEEKMERLRRKLHLTPEQDAAIAAHHSAQRDHWIEYLTGAAVGEANPQFYHFEVSYRPDVPADLAELLSPEQRELLAEHETNRRANFLEATTNGELGSLALKLDLPESAKEGLFQRLSTINGTDLFEDYTGVTDLTAIASQADRDIERRRTAFAEVLDATQMHEWESVVAAYRTGLLRRFGHREPDVIANTQKPADGAS